MKPEKVSSASGRGGADEGGVVVVDAVPVERGRDDLEVVRHRPGHQGGEAVVRVAAGEDGVREEPVGEGVVQLRPETVLVRVPRRPDRGVGEGRADIVGARGAQGPDGEAVGEELVVGGGQGVEEEGAAGGVLAQGVAEEGDLGGLVDGDPHRDPVREPFGDDARVLREAVGGVPVEPAARLLQRERGVPVVEGRGGGDAVGAQLVDEPVVEVESVRVDGPAAAGDHARPADGEPERVGAEPGEQGHVLAVAVVEAGGAGGVGAVLDPAGQRGEGVPPRGALPVGVHGPLGLERGGGGPPEEAGRELRYGHLGLHEPYG